MRKQNVGSQEIQEENLPVARLFKNNTNSISLENMRTALKNNNPKSMKPEQV